MIVLTALLFPLLDRTILSILTEHCAAVVNETDSSNPHQKKNSFLSSSDFRQTLIVLIPRDRWVWGAAGLFLLLGSLSLNYGMLYTPDSIRYLIWAQSLSQFDGFVDLASAEPTRYVIHAPLYSLLLAPFIGIFSWDVLVAKILTLLAGVMFLLIAYRWMVRRTGETGARIGALVLAVHPLVLLFSTHILSDVPFAAVVLVCLMMTGSVKEDRLSGQTIMLALLVAAAIFLREVGLAVMVSIVAFLVLRKKYRVAGLVFVLSVVLYAGWFIRNEIIVAGMEQPAMQNSRLFFSPLYTPRSAGMVAEFMARIQSNGAFYLESLGELLLFPVQLRGAFPVVANDDFLMPLVNGGLTVLSIPLGLLQIGLAVWGILLRRKADPFIPLLFIFLPFYFGLILLYPIIDNRFLFPLLPIVLGYALVGCMDGWTRACGKLELLRKPAWVPLLLFILILPNVVWVANLAANNIRFNTMPDEEFETERIGGQVPEFYRKPFRMVGEWIRENTDSSAVIATRWKELTFWSGGRKLIEVDPVMSLSAFESVVRDYKAEYLVVLSALSGLRDLEFPMIQSRRFLFTPVYRAGGVEVVKILPPAAGTRKGLTHDDLLKGSIPLKQEEVEVRRTFREGVLYLERGDYRSAHERFKLLWDQSGGSGVAALFTGITLGFAGQGEGAMAVFREFKARSQAGAFLQHAWYHQELLTRLSQAEANPIEGSKAQMLRSVAANYLDLGFRYQARKVINRAIDTDSSYYPAMTFGMYCALEEGDTTGARGYVSLMRELDPRRPLTGSMLHLFSLFDSLKSSSDRDSRIRYLFSLASIYDQAGLREYAIDHLLGILSQDPENTRAMVGLGTLYGAKRRWTPAVTMWHRAQERSPGEAVIPEEIRARLDR